MTRSEVSQKLMEIMGKTNKPCKLTYESGVFRIHIGADCISLSELNLSITSGPCFTAMPFSEIYSINVWDTYAVIHLVNRSARFLLNF